MLSYKIDKKTQCWNWAKSLNHNGYPVTTILGKTMRAHRVFYEAYKGVIPKGFQIDHLCKNIKCVNPNHLEAVTPRENVLRSNVTKISKELAQEIRCLDGFMIQDEIALIFGINQSQVSRIINCKSGQWQK